VNWDNLAIPWQIRQALMILIGFVCLSACAFILGGLGIGLGVTGVLLFLLEIVTRPAVRT
jgi:hypothetical protein